LQRADVDVREALCGNMRGMPGSTAVLVYVIEGQAHVAWVGDSRAYLVRRGRVVERTRDHKLVDELVAAGQLTPEEAEQSTLTHVVTRALGGRDPSEPPVDVAVLGHPWQLDRDDVILVCSDGISDLVRDAEVPSLIADGAKPKEGAAKLVQVALERGGHDNITAIVGRWHGPALPRSADPTPMIVERAQPPQLEPVVLADLEGAGRITEEIEVDARSDFGRRSSFAHRQRWTEPEEDTDVGADDRRFRPIVGGRGPEQRPHSAPKQPLVAAPQLLEEDDPFTDDSIDLVADILPGHAPADESSSQGLGREPEELVLDLDPDPSLVQEQPPEVALAVEALETPAAEPATPEPKAEPATPAEPERADKQYGKPQVISDGPSGLTYWVLALLIAVVFGMSVLSFF